jgi:hypothetical protein
MEHYFTISMFSAILFIAESAAVHQRLSKILSAASLSRWSGTSFSIPAKGINNTIPESPQMMPP